MRDPGRILKILAKVAIIWRKYPDLRLGQLIVNTAKGDTDEDKLTNLFYVEDDKLIKRLKNTYGKK